MKIDQAAGRNGRRYLNTQQAAAYLGMSPTTLNRMHVMGEGSPHARRRAWNLCTDCGAWAETTARCDPFARRSYAPSAEHRGIPTWPTRFTAIELATGIEHGTFDSEAEVAACLDFARLGPNDVKIDSDASPMARFTART